MSIQTNINIICFFWLVFITASVENNGKCDQDTVKQFTVDFITDNNQSNEILKKKSEFHSTTSIF